MQRNNGYPLAGGVVFARGSGSLSRAARHATDSNGEIILAGVNVPRIHLTLGDGLARREYAIDHPGKTGDPIELIVEGD